MSRAPLAMLALAALSLTGCYEEPAFAAIVDDAGVGAALCGAPVPWPAGAPCHTRGWSPARTRATTFDPYPIDAAFLAPAQRIPSPIDLRRVIEHGVVPVSVPWVQEPPAIPLVTTVKGSDACRSACDAEVGVVRWSWQYADALRALDVFPWAPTMHVSCAVLPRPRPVCPGDPGATWRAAVARALDAGDYRDLGDGRTFLSFGPGLASTGFEQLQIGRAFAAACAQVNRWDYDRDADGAGDGCDNCVDQPNRDQANADGDGPGDACDPCPALYSLRASQDRDGDGAPDCVDVCPDVIDLQGDADGDGVGDACDRCRNVPDPEQRDTDGDGWGDACDVCPELDDDQRDRDGDGVGDACQCVVPDDRDAQRCWDFETRPEVGGVPGLLTCPDGANAPVCRSAWPDFDTWVNEEIFGPDFTDSPEALADWEAVEIDYMHDDGVAHCPPGAHCQANRQQQRGRDYEDWLCARERRLDRRTRCAGAPLGQRNTSYRAEALRWELPGQLGNHEMQEVVILPEGRLRHADYKIPPVIGTHGTTVLGEAKCYNPFIEWSPRSWWSWHRSVAFGTQLWDYVNKVMRSLRTPDRHVAVYHFCDFIPRWAAYEIAAAIAATAAHGFTARSRDSPAGAAWIQAPGCYVDMAQMLWTVAPELFRCFVPGQNGPDELDPTEACTGSFYDFCSGSE